MWIFYLHRGFAFCYSGRFFFWSIFYSDWFFNLGWFTWPAVGVWEHKMADVSSVQDTRRVFRQCASTFLSAVSRLETPSSTTTSTSSSESPSTPLQEHQRLFRFQPNGEKTKVYETSLVSYPGERIYPSIAEGSINKHCSFIKRYVYTYIFYCWLHCIRHLFYMILPLLNCQPKRKK